MKIEIPEYAQGAPMTKTDEAARPSMTTLSTTLNGQFVLKVGNDKKNLGDKVEIIILAVKPEENFVNHKVFFGYQAAMGASPVCMSEDGTKPSAFVESPQSSDCENCKWNKPGSAGVPGRQTRACKTYKDIYAVFPEDMENFFLFRVPVTSLKNLSNYRWELKSHGAPISGVKTLLTFDKESAEYTVIQFSYNGFLGKEVFKLSMERAMTVTKALPGPQTISTPPEIEDKVEANPTPEPEKPKEETTNVLKNLFQKKEPEPKVFKLSLDIIISALPSTRDEMEKYLLQYEDYIGTLSEAQQQELSSAVLEKLTKKAEQPAPVSIVDQWKEKIKNAPDAKTLASMLEEIKELSAPDAEAIKETFIEAIECFNGERFNDSRHSEKKMQVKGYPSLLTDGGYRAKRNSGVSDNAPAEKGKSALSGILAGLKDF